MLGQMRGRKDKKNIPVLRQNSYSYGHVLSKVRSNSKDALFRAKEAQNRRLLLICLKGYYPFFSLEGEILSFMRSLPFFRNLQAEGKTLRKVFVG